MNGRMHTESVLDLLGGPSKGMKNLKLHIIVQATGLCIFIFTNILFLFFIFNLWSCKTIINSTLCFFRKLTFLAAQHTIFPDSSKAFTIAFVCPELTKNFGSCWTS